MKYRVTVRWMAEARIEVNALTAEGAEEIVQARGLPWDEAEEGDDGGSTTWDAEAA